jgi:ABC-type multidrug transport system ATPase subunit
MIENVAIRATELIKRYREVTAVDSLDLAVRTGEIYGFLGRNGAGKTTTVRMMLGLVGPNHGRVTIFGTDVAVSRREATSGVGSLVETATAYPNLTVRENLEMERKLRQTSQSEVEQAIELLGLTEYADRRAGRLSLGNKQWLALARAMVAHPKLLVLDEPANGLDPAGIVEIRHLLRRLSDKQGITIFVSSHILGEIAQLVDRIGIIHRGRLVDEIDATTIKGGSEGIELRVSNVDKARAVLRSSLGIGRITEGDAGTLSIADGRQSSARVARALIGAGLDLHMIRPVQEDLETRFLRLTGDEQ